jgi:ABC-type transporter Mla subunit MlaD
MPETGQILADVGRTSRAAEQAGNLASALPTVLAREREATIEQFVTAFSEQQRQIRTLVVELRQALEAGTATSDSLNTTIRSLDTLVARFKGTQHSTEQALPPSRPFNIVEYAEAAREFANTTRELEGLIRTLDSGAPGVVTVTHGALADSKYLVNYTFWHIAALLVLLVVLLFAAAVAYRILFARTDS